MRTRFHQNTLKSERGQVILMTALLIIPILGMVGIATDSGYLFFTRRAMQTAADSAALAGSFDQANNSTTSTDTVTAAAKADSKTNGFEDGVDNVTVTVHTPPTSGSFQNADYVEVIIQKTVPTVFLKMLSLIGTSVGDKTVKARAVAGRASIKACFVAMNSSAAGTFNVSGGATINTPDCGIFVNSSSSTALTSGSSGQCVTNLSTDVVGNKSLGCTFSPTPVPGAGAVTDPLASLAVPTKPSGACINPANSGAITLDPTKVYCKLSFNGDATLSLAAGATSSVIYIQGQGGTAFAVKTSGTTVTSSGMMFYVESGGIGADPNTKLTLTAPASGTYQGIAFFQARTNTSGTSFKGSGSTNCKSVSGIVYALAADINFNSNAGDSGSCTMNGIFIGDTISLSGGFQIGSPLVVPTVHGKSHLVE
jgi:Flp pilus assembly protein TadG